MSKLLNPLRTEYLDHIEKQKSSGLSISKYCEANNLIKHKFSYYRSYDLKAESKKKSKFAKVEIKKEIQF